jgi:hypothetical protein
VFSGDETEIVIVDDKFWPVELSAEGFAGLPLLLSPVNSVNILSFRISASQVNLELPHHYSEYLPWFDVCFLTSAFASEWVFEFVKL